MADDTPSHETGRHTPTAPALAVTVTAWLVLAAVSVMTSGAIANLARVGAAIALLLVCALAGVAMVTSRTPDASTGRPRRRPSAFEQAWAEAAGMQPRPPASVPGDPQGFYALLGVGAEAAQEDIARAYRERARVAHPDRGGDLDAMQALNRAYSVLKDPARRRAYDRGERV